MIGTQEQPLCSSTRSLGHLRGIETVGLCWLKLSEMKTKRTPKLSIAVVGHLLAWFGHSFALFPANRKRYSCRRFTPATHTQTYSHTHTHTYTRTHARKPTYHSLAQRSHPSTARFGQEFVDTVYYDYSHVTRPHTEVTIADDLVESIEVS
jgi:hypothetical protein